MNPLFSGRHHVGSSTQAFPVAPIGTTSVATTVALTIITTTTYPAVAAPLGAPVPRPGMRVFTLGATPSGRHPVGK